MSGNGKNEVREIVVAALGQVLEEAASQLAGDTNLADHNWDSLTSLEFLSRVEGELGISLDLREFYAAKTVDDLVGLAASM